MKPWLHELLTRKRVCLLISSPSKLSMGILQMQGTRKDESWWGKQKEDRGLAWTEWKKSLSLCGIGFRKMFQNIFGYKLNLLSQTAYLLISNTQRPFAVSQPPGKCNKGTVYMNVCACDSPRGCQDDDNGTQHLDCISYFFKDLYNHSFLILYPCLKLQLIAFILSVLQSMIVKQKFGHWPKVKVRRWQNLDWTLLFSECRPQCLEKQHNCLLLVCPRTPN